MSAGVCVHTGGCLCLHGCLCPQGCVCTPGMSVSTGVCVAHPGSVCVRKGVHTRGCLCLQGCVCIPMCVCVCRGVCAHLVWLWLSSVAAFWAQPHHRAWLQLWFCPQASGWEDSRVATHAEAPLLKL